MKSLGFIETKGVTAAIEALDVMTKTADVEFVTWERRLGGWLVTVIVQGSLSAVTEAVNAAQAAALKEPCVGAVIGNPHEEIIRIVNTSAERLGEKTNG